MLNSKPSEILQIGDVVKFQTIHVRRSVFDENRHMYRKWKEHRLDAPVRGIILKLSIRSDGYPDHDEWSRGYRVRDTLWLYDVALKDGTVVKVRPEDLTVVDYTAVVL